MSKGAGKGRISNNLVAASCAAILTVYAAGYWRTRDEARRLETRAQERRPPRPTGSDASVAVPDPEIVDPPASIVADPPPPAETTVTADADAATAEPHPADAVPASAPPPPKSSTPPPVARTVAKPAKKLPPKVATAAPAAPPPAPSGIHPVPIEEPLAAQTAVAAPPPAPEAAPASVEGRWRDGTFTGWGYSNHGDILAKVVIENGRIVGSGVAQCATRYPCDVIDLILFQPVDRQSPDVDKVSRATESADAYYYGLVEALKKAEAPADAATTTAK